MKFQVVVGLILAFLLLSNFVSAQDEELLAIKTVYFTPISEENELHLLRECIKDELGWEVTDDVTEADAIWVLGVRSFINSAEAIPSASGIYNGASGYGPPAGTRLPKIQYEKTVAVFTNSEPPRKMWETSRVSSSLVSQYAVKKLKKTLEELSEP